MLETNPLMAQPYGGIEGTPILFFCHNKETFQATIRAFGAGKKDHDADSLMFTPDFPLKITVYGFKNQICKAEKKRVKVPEQIIEAQPARDATETVVIPAHEEEVTEYVCAPFLGDQ